jgi:hypothetical protein
MKVKEMITLLEKMPPDAECYFNSFEGWLDHDNTPTNGEITEKEYGTIYGVDVEHKTVLDWNWRKQIWIPYTGAHFEVD